MNPASILPDTRPARDGVNASLTSSSRRSPAGRRARTLVMAGIWLLAASSAQAADVRPVTPELRRSMSLDPFYQKHTQVGALHIVSSNKASDFALLEAAYIIRNMLDGRDDILQALADRGRMVAVMAHNEYTTDLPDQRGMKPPVFWDSRARGINGRTCSCAEENLLCYPGDPYPTENILIHEFAHAIQGVVAKVVDPDFDSKLGAAYQNAMERGLWKNTYAGSNTAEYWAECSQDWFDNNRHDDALHNHVHTRDMLKQYDPAAAKLCAIAYGDKPWRYLKPAARPPAGRAHLAGYEPAKAPRFHWREVPIPDKPHVVIETELGNIEVELDNKAAPLTVGNFLYYVRERLLNDGRFFRTVTPDNQPDDQVKIQVVQIEADPSRTSEFPPPITLERTSTTGLRHLDGTLSMARDKPDSARDSFSICVGDQPELDFGGKRNPDGQGFAAFGKVTRGMDVVRKIQAAPAVGQQLRPPMLIRRAIRLD